MKSDKFEHQLRSVKAEALQTQETRRGQIP